MATPMGNDETPMPDPTTLVLTHVANTLWGSYFFSAHQAQFFHNIDFGPARFFWRGGRWALNRGPFGNYWM